MFTLVHAFANYLLAVPFRKHIDVIALLLASILPDIEGIYHMPAAYAACGADAVCAAEYPSHFMLHSFFGIFLIIAPIALVLSFYLRKKIKRNIGSMKIIYLSALAGGLLHLVADLTYHRGADSLYLLWPLPQQFSFAFAGSEILWDALAGAGIVAFLLIERKRIVAMI